MREGFSKEWHLSWKDGQEIGKQRMGDTNEIEGPGVGKNWAYTQRAERPSIAEV